MYAEEPETGQGVYKGNSYYEVDALSNSKLGTIVYPIRYFFPKKEDQARHFLIGSVVDCILTTPEDFESLHAYAKGNRAWGKMGKFVERLAELGDELTDETFEQAYNESGYEISLTAVKSAFFRNPDNLHYFRSIVKNKGKTLIPEDEAIIAKKCVEAIRKNPLTNYYFSQPSPLENREVLHQVAIYFFYKERKCKALLDGLLIDHDKKEIQPFDLKTTGKDVFAFEQGMRTFGYYRQAAFYTIALNSDESPVKKLLEDGYKILPFRFIVVETQKHSDAPALVYQISKKDLECGISGCDSDKIHYYGVDELIDLIDWHERNEQFYLPKRLIDNDYIIETNIF